MDNFIPAPPPEPRAPAQMPAQSVSLAMRPAAAVALEALGNRVVELEQSIVELLSRVQPVLTPTAPVGPPAPQMPTPPAPPKAARSALCGSVESIALSVSQITKTVNDVIKRVEV